MFVSFTFNQTADSNDINNAAKVIESLISVITSANPSTAAVDATVISQVTLLDATPTTWVSASSRRRGADAEDLPASTPVQVGDYWQVRNSDYPNPEKYLYFKIIENVGNAIPTKYTILVANNPYDAANQFVAGTKPVDGLKIVTGESYLAFLAGPQASKFVNL